MQSQSEYTKRSVLKFTLFNLEKNFASKLVPWKNVFQQLAKTCQMSHSPMMCRLNKHQPVTDDEDLR